MEQLFKETAIFINAMPYALATGLVAGLLYYCFLGKNLRKAFLQGAFFSYSILLLNRVWLCRINRTISDVSPIPFSTLDNEAHIVRFALNIIMFVPMGIFLFAMFPKVFRKNVVRMLLCGAAVSLIIEAGQGIFKLGHVQSDDVIANTFGVLVGWMIAKISGSKGHLRDQ